jgi:hypothetical protein
MRARNIKPGFFKDGKITQLQYEHRLLFIGLWCISDRDGYFRNEPREIKSEIFPDQPVDVEAGMEALEASGLIELYSFDAQDYGHVINFNKHQNPHINEKTLGYPLAPKAIGRPRKSSPARKPNKQAPVLHGADTVLAPELHGATRDDSLLMNDDTGFPLTLPPKPEPNGNGNSELMNLVQALQTKYPSMAISTILGNHLNKPKEIKVLCIQRMLSKDAIHYPAQYLDNILDKESAKHYARLEEQKSEQIVQEEKAMILRLNETTQTFE